MTVRQTFEAPGAPPRWHLPAFLVAALLLALGLHFGAPLIRDPDELYHFRHAALYLERGPLLTAFPWTAHSVIRREGADLWYGFHLALAPFALVSDPNMGLHLAGAAVLAGMMALVYTALARLGIAYPALWAFTLALAAPPALLRTVVLRPHVLSLGLIAWVLAGLIRREPRVAFLSALAFAFIHLNLTWVVPLLMVVTAVTGRVAEKSWAPRSLLAALGGLVCGWLLRPNPFGAAKLLYVQLVQWSLEKQRGTPLLIGGEARPVDPRDFGLYFAPLLLLWLVAAVLVLRLALRQKLALPAREAVVLWSTLILSVVFFEMTIVVSLRASDQWKLFTLFFLAAFTTSLLRARSEDPEARLSPQARRRLAAIGGVALALSIGRTLGPEGWTWLGRGIPADRLRTAAEWLARNSRPGDIVFHARWQVFPELFFWNRANHYIQGMDPIFLYSLDPDRYWKAHHLATGQAGRFTCGLPECPDSAVQETYTVLARDFRARYLLIEANLSPNLDYATAQDRRYELRFSDNGVKLYELVKPAP